MSVLRQSHTGRRHGLLSMVAEEIYNYIQGGGKNLKKAFHLGSRLSRRLQQVVHDRLLAIRSRKAELDRQVLDAIRT